MFRQLIFGPPGTGKTTTLLTILEELLEHYQPEEIAFVSFTRKGVYEGTDRAKLKFGFSNRQMPYFKTLHSIAFHDGNYSKRSLLSMKDYRNFSQSMNMNFTGYYTEEFRHNDDQYLFYDSLVRNNAARANSFKEDLDYQKLKYVIHNFKKFKEHTGRIDFTSMLETFVASNKPLPVKVAIVDEAQDLTSLQWQMVEIAFKNVEKLYIAGDDDQAIYEWSGADVDYFLQVPGERVILDKSYRLPESILELSKQITSLISNRVDKQFSPMDQKGSIHYYNSLDEIRITKDEDWLLLSRNNFHLRNYTNLLCEEGINHTYKGEKFADEKEIRQIRIFEKLRKDRQAPQGESSILLGQVVKEDMNLSLPWYQNFNWPENKCNYYRGVFRNKQDISKWPNVHINTIHGSKGGEADNVVLQLDVSANVSEAIEKWADSELRCLYVGITRARKNLHIIQAKGKYSYDKFIRG